MLYRGEGEDEGGGGVAQGGGAGAQGPPPAHVGREVEHQALDPGAKVGDFKYVVVDGKYVVEGREEGGPHNRVGTHRPRCEGRAGRGPDQGGGRRELLGPPGEAVEEVQPHPGRS